MFNNPIQLTIGMDFVDLVKVNQDNYGSEYRSRTSTGEVILKIRHSTDNDGMLRHNVLIESKTYATAELSEKVRQISLTIREPSGSDPTPVLDLASAFLGFANDGFTVENLTKGLN